MKKIIYSMGRVLQLTSLIALPLAIWVGHFGRDEKGAIVIFVGSVAVFFAGVALSRITFRS